MFSCINKPAISRVIDLTGWLTDESINAYFELIEQRYSTRERHIYCVNSFFYPAVHNGGPINRFIDEYEMKTATIILIPILRHNHWMLLMISRITNDVQLFNSFLYSPEQAAIISTEINSNVSKFPLGNSDHFERFVVQEDIPRQLNCDDCGVYTLLFAKNIARNLPITEGCIAGLDIPKIRYQIAYELINKRIEFY